MFNGSIEGAGPRYCPSIEDKVARYVDKPSHPIFLEPEGWQTNELYVQGLSTSLPPDVQRDVVRSIVGLENAQITRFGYAVEYDSVDANELEPTLQSRSFPGLFLAGQVNGTSGYEEAAGQGLVAGLNASRFAQSLDLVSIPRTTGYLGVMIDDLVNLPFNEPYRMLTARAEYRLLMRPDSAERRFNALAHAWGLVGEDRYNAVATELAQLDSALAFFRAETVNPNSATDNALQDCGQTPVAKPMSLAEILRRPSMSLAGLSESLPDRVAPVLSGVASHRIDELESDLKYAAFIEREDREVTRLRQVNGRSIPDTQGAHIPGLRNEARQQLELHRPRTYGDAQRLAGVTHSDLSALLIHQSRLDHVHQ
jgi:tRNA uridine 5-carboxymethylaminomethyl modification enzyme